MKTYKTSLKRFRIVAEPTDFPKVKITNSKVSAEFIRQFYNDDIGVFESFFILLLNRANNTVGYAKISQGGIAGTVVDKMIIAKYVVDNMASSVILAHNHPSGQMFPSEADKQLTRDLVRALSFLNCNVLDHIILSPEQNQYYSFSDNGEM